MTGLLEGVKVIEMGSAVAVPSAATMMADWGAEVIKVEHLFGEIFRGTRRVQGVATSAAREQTHLHNRNKKGLAVDLKKEGVETSFTGLSGQLMFLCPTLK